jgi:hypothetical protein
MDRFSDDVAEFEDSDHYVEPEQLQRRGGPKNDDDDDEEDAAEAKRKAEDRERKKAEVRARLQEAGKAKKAKKGFLTPERKKKLRKLLMQKAAEDLKQQQLLKEQERQRILQQRIIKLPQIDGINNQSELEQIARDFHKRIIEIYDSKYDLDYEVRQKDFEINEMTIAVNDLRGKFVKPALKKVSKYDNKLKKLQAANEEKKVDFRANLKNVKKDTYGLDNLLSKTAEKKEGEEVAE